MTERRRPSGEMPAPDLVEAMRDALVGPREEVTLDECAACKRCPLCDGVHMVTAAQNAEWRRAHP